MCEIRVQLLQSVQLLGDFVPQTPYRPWTTLGDFHPSDTLILSPPIPNLLPLPMISLSALLDHLYQQIDYQYGYFSTQRCS